MRDAKDKILVHNVNKMYGKVHAVKNLTFTVNPSVCFGFLGPNGAGKTTMMKMIYGKAERDKKPLGTISVFGCDPACSELDIKYFSGVVPQDNNLDEELNVWQNLSVFARFYKLDRKTAGRRIEELLEFMELSEKKKVPLRALSGGMKRRLIIARALLNNPRLLILDEPTTGLDPQVRHVIWDKIRSLKKQGMTVLLTTHYMEEAFQICDRIIIMDKGEKVMEGNPKKLLKENIEPYVLELAGGEDMLKKISKIQLKKVRHDKTGDVIRLYADEADLLKTIARPLQSGEYVFRPSNLEDVFLKITGSELNALQ